MREYHRCHLCAAMFYDDNSLALHSVRHRSGEYNDRQTNMRQARRSQIDDLKEIWDATH